MRLSCVIICAICIAGVFSTHLTHRLSDARTQAKTQLMSSLDTEQVPVPTVQTPVHSEVNSVDIARESAEPEVKTNTGGAGSQTNHGESDPQSPITWLTHKEDGGDVHGSQALAQTGHSEGGHVVDEIIPSENGGKHTEASTDDLDEEAPNVANGANEMQLDTANTVHGQETTTHNNKHHEHDHAQDNADSVSGIEVYASVSPDAVETADHEGNTHADYGHTDSDTGTIVNEDRNAINDAAEIHNTEENASSRLNDSPTVGPTELPYSSLQADETITPASNVANITATVNDVSTTVNDVTTNVTDVTTTRKEDDVDPLNIFVDDIKFQRFPKPMDLSVFREKIAGNRFKLLYILEETEQKLFARVRQLEAKYKMEEDEDTLYVTFDYRFIFTRECQKIKKFELGKLVGNNNEAYFEKDIGDGYTERIMFFTESPDDYVYLMSCTDRKTSPYACRDTFYVTLGSRQDPPNQFPWLLAAEELKMKMDLSFKDPRFVFNFVMTPCVDD